MWFLDRLTRFLNQRERENTYMWNLSVREVSGKLLEYSDCALNSKLVGVLQGGHQDVKELGPLVRKVPLSNGRYCVGDRGANLRR